MTPAALCSLAVFEYFIRCALHVAAAAGHSSVVKLLLETGASTDVVDNWYACHRVCVLLQPNHICNPTHDSGCNSLHHDIILQNKADSVSLLVAAGADINARNIR